MANEQVVKYFRENKELFSPETLVEQLKQSGYPETEILEGMAVVYSETSGLEGGDLRYGGFWIRVLAAFIDTVVLWGVQGVLNFFLVSLLSGRESTDSFGFLHVSVFTSLFSLLITYLLITYGYMIFLTHRYGATLGKMAVGVTVQSAEGGRAPFGKIVLRETIGKFVSSIIIGIGFLMAGFTKRKQGLHDFIANTVVIRTR